MTSRCSTDTMRTVMFLSKYDSSLRRAYYVRNTSDAQPGGTKTRSPPSVGKLLKP